MIKAAALALMLAASAAWGGVAEDAAQASAELQKAVGDLQEASASKDRIAALTRTIKAYEQGLASLGASACDAILKQGLEGILATLEVSE